MARLTKGQLGALMMDAAMPDSLSSTIKTPLLRALIEEREHFRKALVEVVRVAGLTTAREVAATALKGTV